MKHRDMKSWLRARGSRAAERGQVIPLVALALAVLMGAAALAVDVGYWRYQQRVEQSAADSAAIAGADELAYPVANDVVLAARKDATSNGYTDDAGVSVRVTVNNPPSSGAYLGNTNAVEVVIQKKMPTWFAGAVLGGAASSVQRRAAGRGARAGVSGAAVQLQRAAGPAVLAADDRASGAARALVARRRRRCRAGRGGPRAGAGRSPGLCALRDCSALLIWLSIFAARNPRHSIARGGTTWLGSTL